MMKTDDFITMLAKDGTVRRRPFLVTWSPVAVAMVLSAVLMAVTLGVRPHLEQWAGAPLFWLKCGFVAALAAAGLRAVRIAAIPGARFGTLPWLLAAPVVLMAIAAVATLLATDTGARAQQFWGSTWRTCPLLIALLALPIFAALLHVMRGLAPTRPRLAGAMAGFAAGATAALLYCLHCPELAPSFVAFWYLLGMLIPTAAGALAGRAVLAW
ncbi:NrsF family protein [Pseudoduganella lutea]|nr:DUF1109 domain-containing protein [Pseudoduganella lutea]